MLRGVRGDLFLRPGRLVRACNCGHAVSAKALLDRLVRAGLVEPFGDGLYVVSRGSPLMAWARELTEEEFLGRVGEVIGIGWEGLCG